MGGGGGNSQTTTSGIDPRFAPYLEEVLSDVTGQYRQAREGTYTPSQSQADALVARDTAEQTEALRTAQGLGRDLSRGYSQADIQRDLRNLQGQQLATQPGSLGSARADRARQGALADRSLQLQQASDARRGQGAQVLQAVGQDRQAKAQARLDAPHTAASRYFGYLGSAPQQQTVSGGGGK